MRRWLGGLGLMLAACSSTQTVRSDQLAIVSGGQAGAAILEDQEGRSVRLDPNSSVRFLWGRSQSWTPWVDARALEVSNRGVVSSESGATFAIDWADIERAEIDNFSGSKTLGLVVVIAAVAVAIYFLVKDGKARFYPPHLVVHVASPPCCDEGTPVYTEPEPRVSIQPELVAPPAAEAPAPTQHLFTTYTRRRASVEIVPAAEASLDTSNIGGAFSQSVSLSARLVDVIDLGIGARHTLAVDEGTGSTFVGFVRLGVQFHLDDEHRIAISLLSDYGTGDEVRFQFKLNTGLRFRLSDAVNAGVFFGSPTYTDRGSGRWTFPSGLELAFAF